MKSKLLVLLLLASLFVEACMLAKANVFGSPASAVKVAVYWETEKIDASERAQIVDAIGVVESRFEDQLGYKVDFEMIGSWTSVKTTTSVTYIVTEAIKETGGVLAPTYDNQRELTWKFHKDGYTAAIYIVEQDLTYLGIPIQGAASPVIHAGIVDYNPHDYWKPFERLCSVIQHEISHVFGLTFYGDEAECNEPWCVMNYEYMPYEEYAGWRIIRWKTKEEWATTWCSNCKQKLQQTYKGITFPCTKRYTYITQNYVVAYSIKWTETYYRWNLTQCRLKSVFVISIPIIRYTPGMAAVHPSFSTLMQGTLTIIEP